MPILTSFTLPNSAEGLQVATLFLAFIASKDPNTGRPWCPDVVAALPILEQTFSGPKAPQAAFIEVGQRPEWRDSKNAFRTKWNVHNVPTLVRFEQVDGKVQEVGRLVEAEILDSRKLEKLVVGRS